MSAEGLYAEPAVAAELEAAEAAGELFPHLEHVLCPIRPNCTRPPGHPPPCYVREHVADYTRVRPVGGTPTARRTDPATSHEAAATVTSSSRLLVRDRVLEVLYGFTGDGPLTDEQLVGHFPCTWGPKATPSGIRTRRCELVDDGLVELADDAGITETGRKANRWQLTEAGWAHVRSSYRGDR